MGWLQEEKEGEGAAGVLRAGGGRLKTTGAATIRLL